LLGGAPGRSPIAEEQHVMRIGINDGRSKRAQSPAKQRERAEGEGLLKSAAASDGARKLHGWL